MQVPAVTTRTGTLALAAPCRKPYLAGATTAMPTKEYPGRGRYEGALKDGKRDGHGTFHYANGNVYVGAWKNDKRHGEGRVTFAAEPGGEPDVYEGAFAFNQMQGHGMYFYADSGVYVGEWLQGKMHGRGAFAFASGSAYDGEWVQDVREGYGTLEKASGERYMGYFKHNKAGGQGMMTYPSGDKYIGDWRDGRRDGDGELHYADGRVYRGKFADNMPTGEGTTTRRGAPGAVPGADLGPNGRLEAADDDDDAGAPGLSAAMREVAVAADAGPAEGRAAGSAALQRAKAARQRAVHTRQSRADAEAREAHAAGRGPPLTYPRSGRRSSVVPADEGGGGDLAC